MKRALVFGSLNVDYVYDVPHFVTAGETLASRRLALFPGGKGLNQSIALARAGITVYHAGAIGVEGRFLLEELRAAGVRTEYIRELQDTPTGHAVIQRNETGENCILLYGGANRCVDGALIDRVLADFGPGDLLVAQNEISCPGLLLSGARERGMTIALNPSPMTEEIKPLLPQADVLLLNEVEASQALGAALDADPSYLLRKVRCLCPGTAVVLTLGERGAIYADDNGLLSQPAIPVQAVDTTAAGDTFTGYFLAALSEGRSPAEALRWAATAAGLAVTAAGASPSIPCRDSVLKAVADAQEARET